MISFADRCPELVSSWAGDLNGDLTPDTVSYGQERKLFWKCTVVDSHHPVWQARVYQRQGGSGCGVCAGQKICSVDFCNSLLKTHPGLSNEWATDINGMGPHEVTAQSHKRVYWRCKTEAHHVWDAMVYTRTNLSNKCPICQGQRICADGCNQLQAKQAITVAEWDVERNAPLTPLQVAPHSNKRVWWKCKEGDHSWQAKVNDRTNHQTTCPHCTTHGYSRKAIQWLDTESAKLGEFIQHAENGGEKRILLGSGKSTKVDGYYEDGDRKVVFEFFGTYFHGCPQLYAPDVFNRTCKKTMGELYTDTLTRIDDIRAAGFEVVSIWEDEWDKIPLSLKRGVLRCAT